MPDPLDFQTLIWKAMEERGIDNLGALASRARMHRSTVYRLMHDPMLRSPTEPTLLRLARALHYPVSILKHAAAVSTGLVGSTDVPPEIARVVEHMQHADHKTRSLIVGVVDQIVRQTTQEVTPPQTPTARRRLTRPTRAASGS